MSVTIGHSAAEPEAAAATAPAAREDYRFEFRGKTGEYFRIWLVNVLLSIVTLGIYSAWAKVRNKRYFYGNTYLAGANFEYHAKPLSILVSRLIVFVGIIGGGALLAGEDPVLVAAHSSLLLLLLPWATARGFAFNARNSSYRGIKFGFHRRYLSLYLIYLPVLIPAVMFYALFAWSGLNLEQMLGQAGGFLAIWYLLLFFLAPILVREYHCYKAENHHLGNISFSFCAPKRGYMLALWGVLIVMFLSIGALSGGLDEESGFSRFLLILAALYALFGFWAFLITGMLFKIFWNGVSAKRGRIVCDISVWRFAFNIQLINYLAMLLTLGLATPWARVRRARYLAENMRLVAEPELMEEIAAAAADRTGALGETLAEAEDFDFEVGLI